MESFVSKPVELPPSAASGRFRRADLVFYGIESRGETYIARVFLDVPGESADTSLEREAGYAGRFVLFGHGGCVGEPGHCDPSENRDPFDVGPPGGLTPQTKTVEITDALKGVVGDRVVVTVVPIRLDKDRAVPADNLAFSGLRLLTYDLSASQTAT